jgi:hypothetical protein
MQTISTTYHGPTDTHGPRITARSSSGFSATVPADTDKDGPARHWPAAQALARRLGWQGTMQAGATRAGFVFAFIDPADQFTI